MTTKNEQSAPQPPDLTKGVAVGSIPDGGMILGRVGEDDVVLAHSGDRFFAIGAHCTHYHGPLAEGLIVGETVRCPLHHACFSLETGEALHAPALDPVKCWRVAREGDRLFVRDKFEPKRSASAIQRPPSSIVIVGGGAAGLAAADMLRREGYGGPVTMISADSDPPVDRPNLSKDYLSGEAQDDWIPLWPPDTFAERRVDLILRRRVSSIDVRSHHVVLDDGSQREFGSLLIATGADPIQLNMHGAERSQVFYLRSFADSRAIIARAKTAKRVLVVGAGFIGLEVAASLRTRKIAVDVVSPENVPLERVMGAEVGGFVRSLHESHGVVFHLGQTVASVAGRTVTLSGGTTIEADFIVVGAGVHPAVTLAVQAGLAIDRGIAVNEYLETSAPGVFAAGDAARWPDPHSGARIRVEHWVVAERMGQAAARNMLGRRERFDAVPFFWSQHYDVAIKYIGHAEKWDSIEVNGSLDARDCSVAYVVNGRRQALVTISRDRESLSTEAAWEREVREPVGDVHSTR
jgi:NADPH-dependent 2,4-dienoyl-CoA reductase/sulfur reductase-like enzyme/nitrite reductase/ring-hydroxylating ferredoxin subunit